MKKIIIIFFILTCQISLAGDNKPIKKDSDSIKKEIQSIQLSVELALNRMNSLVKKNDSLNRDLLYYKAKEDYYSDALSEQSTRFALIITGILGVLALLSFGVFRYEVNRISKSTDEKLTAQNKEFQLFKNKIQKIDRSLNVSAANTFRIIAMNYEKEGSFIWALTFYLYASKNHGEGVIIELELEGKKESEVDKKKKFQYTLANLKSALTVFQKIKADASLKGQITSEKDKIIEALDEIGEIDFEDTKDICAEIRVGIKNYLK